MNSIFKEEIRLFKKNVAAEDVCRNVLELFLASPSFHTFILINVHLLITFYTLTDWKGNGMGISGDVSLYMRVV